MAAEENRCPNCGALVVADAEWCGQCYTPLRVSAEIQSGNQAGSEEATSAKPESSSDIEVSPLSAPDAASSLAEGSATGEAADAGTVTKDEIAIDVAPDGTSWTCPSCDHENSLDLDTCPVCGTPFARLFAEETEVLHVEPDRAILLSAVPGLGHWVCGQRGEAVTRFLFVVWGLIVGLLGLLAKTSTQYSGGAILHPIGLLYILSALIVYGIGFIDAHRAATGREQYLSMKVMLYWFAALIFIFLIGVFAAFFSVTKTRISPGGGGSISP